ncbi:hypothetical protein MBBA_0608 [Methanoculleus bourgensis]|nr:hypothetical protein MBBA_0608 [Methanoculleus bourgensis]
MVNSVTGESMLQITVDQLARTLCASAILGAPVEAGDRVIIPVAEFGFGFGGGEGTGGIREGKQSGGSGTGGGGGISAVALVLVNKGVPGPEGIQVISLKKKSEIAEVITTLGETVGPHISKAIEKGGEMMMQRKGGAPEKTGKEIPISGEEEV